MRRAFPGFPGIPLAALTLVLLFTFRPRSHAEDALGITVEDVLGGDLAGDDLDIISGELFEAAKLDERALGELSSELLAEAKAERARRSRRQAPAMPAKPLPVEAAALRRAIDDLIATWGDAYPGGKEYLDRLARIERDTITSPDEAQAKLVGLQQEALLANPLLAFDRLLFVRRRGGDPGLPQNWQGNCALGRRRFDNEIAVLSPAASDGAITTLHHPTNGVFVGDTDLHFSGDRLLFSSIGTHGRWQVFEIGTDGEDLRQVTTGEHADINNYDACYLPNGRIIFASTAALQGVPCVGGRDQVANLYLMEADGTGIRQLCFDQDHNWCPTVLNDGRVMFTRWEYSDTPHYFTRLLFRMNPDGSGQMAHYGSNSYWPNSIFYARPIPGHPTRIVGIVSGHHGVARMGELIVFDPALGQHEARGVVQRIPGYGKKVSPVIRDQLVNASWPRFLHPYPLGEPGTGRGGGKYFLVSCQPHPGAPWGIYVADVFDNIVKLKEEPGSFLFEPVPLQPTEHPPVIPDRVRPDMRYATVYLADVYAGPGLAGVPRGTIKSLRLFSFDYGYRGLANHTYIGIDGPWDVHRILGTVPVESDGSALFRVPANTPISVQPLDGGGRAVQLMRSWFTAMPGEQLSCVGCHESPSRTPPLRAAAASYRRPAEIEPWYGPARGFSFDREVQPVVDRHCIGCHNGTPLADGEQIPDLRPPGADDHGVSRAYRSLHRYVRRPGPESDYHILPAGEYHADTSELMQMLAKGHGNVRLDPESVDRLVTWIDLNVPYYGTWGEFREIPAGQRERRRELRERYAGITEDYEIVPLTTVSLPVPPPPVPRTDTAPEVECPGWPFTPEEAAARQKAAGGRAVMRIEVGRETNGQAIAVEFVRIPAGEFVAGSRDGHGDEQPLTRVRIERPFWISRHEVPNRIYALFDPGHESGYFNPAGKDQSNRGVPMNSPDQPVVRVSWQQATAFCRWMSQKSGTSVALPTEVQWEYACRSGSDRAFWYGGPAADFARHANVADAVLAGFRGRGGSAWRPADKRGNDRAVVTAAVGSYEPNAWGLHDMHGNAAEWTRTTYRAYPYDPSDGRDGEVSDGRKVVRGGSFYDRPQRCRSSFRLSYPSWRPVFNVGFRLVIGSAPRRVAGPATERVPTQS